MTETKEVKATHTIEQVRRAQDLALEFGHLNQGIASLVDLYATAPELLGTVKAYRQILFGMIESPSYRPSSALVEELYKLAADAIAKAEAR